MKKLPIMFMALLMSVLFAACIDANDDVHASNTQSIPEESVTETETSEYDLADYAPYGTEGATKIIISPDDFGEKIPDFMFNGNNELTDVYIMDGVTEIGVECFAFCTSLKSVRLPDTLNAFTFGGSAFSDCPAQESVIIPGSLKTVLTANLH